MACPFVRLAGTAHVLAVLLFFMFATTGALPAEEDEQDVLSTSRPTGLTKFVPFEVQVSDGNSGSQKPMHILVPATAGEFQISQPADLFQHVRGALLLSVYGGWLDRH